MEILARTWEMKKEVQQKMNMMIAAMLICCSSPRGIISLTPLMCGKNLTRPEPQNIRGSRVALDARLPWYTSGFV